MEILSIFSLDIPRNQGLISLLEKDACALSSIIGLLFKFLLIVSSFEPPIP